VQTDEKVPARPDLRAGVKSGLPAAALPLLQRVFQALLCRSSQNLYIEKNPVMKKSILLALGLFVACAVSLRAADAKETWEKNCAKCHGSDGKGDTKMGKKVGVKDYTDPKVQAEMTDDKMFKSVKEGIKDGDKTKMKPAEGLSDDEIKAMVAYVRAFGKK
jgi:cytochrome c5